MADEEMKEDEPTPDAPAAEDGIVADAETTASAPDADLASEEAPAGAEAPVAEAARPAAPAAPAEPQEVLSPKERRQRARAAKAAEVPTRPPRTPEERQAERDAERRRKATIRRTRRQREREKTRARRAAATAGPLAPRREKHPGQQKTRQGVVVSDKASKTIVVRIDVTRRHPFYEKIVRTSRTVHAHDEREDAHVGDTVVVRESRPLSRTKRWRLVEVVERAR